jgi:hypothetical protein
MTEPTSATTTGLVAVAVALLGPAAGEYAVIVLSALAGSLWALSRIETTSRASGAALIARLVLTAVVLTGGLSYWLESEYDWPVHQILAPVAFAIGALGDRWPALLDSLWRRLLGRITGSPAP